VKTLALLVEPMGGLLRRLLYLFALSAITVLMLAPAALAQSGMESEGGPSGPYGLYICADFADRLQAQEAYLQGGNGSDPAADRSILDPNGNGIACEDLPPADRETPVEERSIGEPPVGEEPEGETGGEGVGADTQGPADDGGETPGSDEGGGNGSGNDSAGNEEGGGSGGGNGSTGNDEDGAASQGGVSGAVSDGFSSVLSGRLPDTGGGWTVLTLLAGAVLIGGGLLVCRHAR